MNPYRSAFYARQAQWHKYQSPEHVRSLHEIRAVYYEWFVTLAPRRPRFRDRRHWLRQRPVPLFPPEERLHENVRGIDLDEKQIEIAQALGLRAEKAAVADYIARSEGPFDLVAMFDIIEHFTREELFPLMEAVRRRDPPGRSIDRQHPQRGKS